jgi:hypothetical protein
MIFEISTACIKILSISSKAILLRDELPLES